MHWRWWRLLLLFFFVLHLCRTAAEDSLIVRRTSVLPPSACFRLVNQQLMSDTHSCRYGQIISHARMGTRAQTRVINYLIPYGMLASRLFPKDYSSVLAPAWGTCRCSCVSHEIPRRRFENTCSALQQCNALHVPTQLHSSDAPQCTDLALSV